ncbi:Starvation-sensing protein RspB [Sporomusa silvacetica DSM 10669]|uniref:Starvation-sensing protein RspB n=1 Tax=Sporomusa silvacetica DSM 10669 TaxID=1123289 RepID=A0ABZ3ITS5_9FIRM|nr:Zn-dependent oxidoreductase [Sporomusa silvacetica]OZC19570.1 putative zinc-type alcohol dehydrogenase-like protein YjmD [Sporomusa silvacetica DSM 10669]
MKAIEIIKPGEIAIVERPIPECKENEVLIKVKAAGICGSDAHIYHGKNAFATYPRVVGHEFAGEIVKVGSQVKNLQVGDGVAVDPVSSCGHCYACRIGRHNVCKSLSVIGVHRDGGYREYVAVDAGSAHKLPKNISWEIAAMIEPYTIAAQVMDRGRLTADDTVLICGAGPIGLILLQAVKMTGARVAIMDIIDTRLNMAKEMAADLVINSKTSDMITEMMAFTNNEGASLILEATGNINVLETCIQKIAAPAGRVVVLGFSTELVKIPQVAIMSKELEIIGTRLNNNKFPQVIEWFAKGLVQPEKILTHTFKFEEVEKAFDFMDKNPADVCKIGLTF